jgi:hypothetical protein
MKRESRLDRFLRAILAVLAIVLGVSFLTRVACVIGGWNNPEDLKLALQVAGGVTAVAGVLTLFRREQPQVTAGQALAGVATDRLEQYRLFLYLLASAVMLFLMGVLL